ncbi:MAG: hypothetical protein JSS90_04030 [Bacteroidetes bacterium]|jgi:hypothetical protein|nr:hypothetical protein [Bacteroidota bacterium]
MATAIISYGFEKGKMILRLKKQGRKCTVGVFSDVRITVLNDVTKMSCKSITTQKITFMHAIDIVLLGGALLCFSIAFLIASRPARQSRAHRKQETIWKKRSQIKNKNINSAELINYLHDETQ